jgi:hypothetical protein
MYPGGRTKPGQLLDDPKYPAGCQEALLQLPHSLPSGLLKIKPMYGSYHWFGSTICFIAAVYFGFQFWLHKSEADETAKWDRISGVIETMTMSTYVGRHGSRSYTPHVSYNFKLKGQTYRGSVIAFPDPAYLTSLDSSSFQKKYPEGGLVSVYYNPQDPAKCCLSPGGSAPLNREGWYAIGMLALAVVLPFFSERPSWGYGAMYNNPTSMITPSR